MRHPGLQPETESGGHRSHPLPERKDRREKESGRKGKQGRGRGDGKGYNDVKVLARQQFFLNNKIDSVLLHQASDDIIHVILYKAWLSHTLMTNFTLHETWLVAL